MKNIYLLYFILLSNIGLSQIGIGTNSPTNTLHVVGSAIVRDVENDNTNLVTPLLIAPDGSIYDEIIESGFDKRVLFKVKIPPTQKIVNNEVAALANANEMTIVNAGQFIYDNITYYLSVSLNQTNLSETLIYKPGSYDLSDQSYRSVDIAQYNASVTFRVNFYSDPERTTQINLPFKPNSVILGVETTNSNKVLFASNVDSFDTTNQKVYRFRITRIDHHFNFWEEDNFYLNVLFIRN